MATLAQMELTVRQCTKCGEEKPFSEFYARPHGLHGLRSSCKVCDRAGTKAWRLANPERAKESQAKWRRENPERQKELTERWRAEHPERVRAQIRRRTARNAPYRRAYLLKRNYGISVERYEEMVEDQRGLCAICESPPPEGKRLSVDHDHEIGVVRSLLCAKCNHGLGAFSEDPARLFSAIWYLAEWGKL